MGVQSKNRATGQSRDHKQPGWIYGAIGGADALSQEMDPLCVSAALTWKHKVKRSMKEPVVSNTLADIPHNEYSWRKYGHEPIKGSPHPRF
ncbi:putative WRKY transcription factor 21 [Tanacetum coccineum]